MHASLIPGPSTQRHPPRSVHALRMVAAGSMLALLPVLPMRTSAQESVYRIRQRATLSQKLGNALISLDYSRPLVRNRTELFGKVVHWGELWTPGANEATVLEVSRDVTLNGTAVPAGRWSMWVIPPRVGPWEMVLDAKDSLFHTQRPDVKDDQIRFPLVDARDRNDESHGGNDCEQHRLSRVLRQRGARCSMVCTSNSTRSGSARRTAAATSATRYCGSRADRTSTLREGYVNCA